MSDSDSDSDLDDSRFASPQSITPTFASRGLSPEPPSEPSHARIAVPLPALATLKPPLFAPAPESLPAEPPPASATEPVSSDALAKAKTALDSLSKIVPDPLPAALSSSPNPAIAALYDYPTTYSVSCLLRSPNSGSGDNPLCRWLYDTFQSNEPGLQLLVLRFVPLLAGVYLARASTQRRHLAGFEAVLLALYSHQTISRASQPVTVTLPELSSPSVYHETLPSSSSPSTNTDPTVGTVSPALDPHGTVQSTCRACIVGVALDLYYGKICLMPVASKVEFCELCDVWAGNADDVLAAADVSLDEPRVAEERIPLPWELMQPALRIVGHCLVGPGSRDAGLQGKARRTCRKLYGRALHDVNPMAILASESLIRMIKIHEEDKETDYTEVPDTRLISI